MRLRRLDLTRYGKFTDFSIDFGEAVAGSPDLHIVYGLNEAGKSTTFSAFLDLLFGIPERSTYNFLHQYNTMQIGARLQFNGGVHEFVRLKQRANSLLDDRGQPVNEAMLSSALGGIGRDAYRTMFSLDDQSLKEGGHDIIQSKGDLGELLFSASAGLAGLNRSLTAASEEAAFLYKKRSSSTRLAELKRHLASLKARREEIDTFATAYSALVSAKEQAQGAYDKAMGELAEARREHVELTRLLNALPLAAEATRLAAQMVDFADLPRPPSEWFALLPQLSRDETRLQTLVDTADCTISELQTEIDAVELDGGLLELAGRIETLEQGRARYRTADTDLPKRRIALAEQEATLAAILASIEQPSHPAPADLLIPASLTGIISELIETRSGVEARQHAAEREVRRARENLVRHRQDRALLHPDAHRLPPDAMARIENALARLNLADFQSRLTLEERARVQLAQAYESRLAALAPWNGDAAALHAMAGAEARQIESWRLAAAAIDKRIADHRIRIRDLETERRSSLSRLAALEEAGTIDDSDARKSRLARDAAWHEHRKTLDDESARAFDDMMRRDDEISERRLARSRELAELRQHKQAAAVAADAIERQRELLDEARAEQDALTAKAAAFLPGGSTPALNETASDVVAEVERWSQRRSQAIEAWQALEAAETGISTIRRQLSERRTALEGTMAATDLPAAALSDEELAEAANALLAEARKALDLEASAQRNLAALERDLAERERDDVEARGAGAKWQAAWQDALDKTWFADKAASVASVREILNVLTGLPPALRERDQLAQRVAMMERDQEAFRVGIAEIVTLLGRSASGADAMVTADQLLDELAACQRIRQHRADKQADLERHVENRRALEGELALHEARKTELIGFFGTDSLTAVNTCLEQVRYRQQLEERLSALKDQIVANLRVENFRCAEDLLAGVDAAGSERAAMELAQRIEDLTERTRHFYAELTRTADRLDAVGGDNSVAALEAQRRTIFLEIEELAQKYLRLRTGTLAAEQALFAYREKHRSSMMVRASEAFRQITRGDYSGLAARPDKDKEILIGIGRDGGSKLAESMSTGTQFQLYLALRLAGYEEFAAVRPAVPFVADDIMESFDDPRSEEVFRLLGDMAKVGQVIYLTHHKHLCDIAASVVPGVTIHDING